MDDRFKVCGNCGYGTMVDGGFVCINPERPGQMPVAIGERQPCFILSPLTQAQTIGAVLAPIPTNAIH